MLGRQHWVAPRRFIIIVQAALDALPCPAYSGSVWGRKRQLTLDGDGGRILRNAELICSQAFGSDSPPHEQRQCHRADLTSLGKYCETKPFDVLY